LLSDVNEYLPGGGSGLGPEAAAAAADDEGVSLGSLDFDEILDEDVLRHKSTVVNRAPVMMAWACVVAERLGFTREEALSIGTPPPPPTISNFYFIPNPHAFAIRCAKMRTTHPYI
jgi:hypothetical protein